MGGLSASGGSVEWLRDILGDAPLSYADLDDLLAQASPGPTGILYFPYLAGSGSPHADVRLRGAFVGLDAAHGRVELAKAVLEGTAYEMEFIRRRAEQVFGTPIDRMVVTGGGTRNQAWMQIKADVNGCRLEVPAMPEATLLGAALIAGVGAGLMIDNTTVVEHLSLDEIKMKLQMMAGSIKIQKWLVIYNALIDPRPVSEIAMHTGLSEASVYRIIADYNNGGPEALEASGKVLVDVWFEHQSATMSMYTNPKLSD